MRARICHTSGEHEAENGLCTCLPHAAWWKRKQIDFKIIHTRLIYIDWLNQLHQAGLHFCYYCQATWHLAGLAELEQILLIGVLCTHLICSLAWSCRNSLAEITVVLRLTIVYLYFSYFLWLDILQITSNIREEKQSMIEGSQRALE